MKQLMLIMAFLSLLSATFGMDTVPRDMVKVNPAQCQGIQATWDLDMLRYSFEQYCYTDENDTIIQYTSRTDSSQKYQYIFKSEEFLGASSEYGPGYYLNMVIGFRTINSALNDTSSITILSITNFAFPYTDSFGDTISSVMYAPWLYETFDPEEKRGKLGAVVALYKNEDCDTVVYLLFDKYCREYEPFSSEWSSNNYLFPDRLTVHASGYMVSCGCWDDAVWAWKLILNGVPVHLRDSAIVPEYFPFINDVTGTTAMSILPPRKVESNYWYNALGRRAPEAPRFPTKMIFK